MNVKGYDNWKLSESPNSEPYKVTNYKNAEEGTEEYYEQIAIGYMDLEYGSYGDHDFHYCTIDNDGELIISFNGCAHECGWVEIQDLEVTNEDGQITYEV